MSAVQPGYKKTEIGTIPEDWSCRALGEFCVAYSGGTPTTSIRDYYGGNIPWITSSDLNQGNIESVSGRITPLGLENSSAKMVNPNSLLIALYGATAGTTAITRISGAINQAVLAIIPKSGSTAFIYQYLQLKKDWIIKTFTQGGQPNLSGEIVKLLIIPTPNESEQSFIAAALSEMDLLIRSLDQLITKKRNIQQAAMQQLLTGQRRLPGFSGEWKVMRLGEICTMKSGEGITSANIDEHSAYPCYGGNGLRGQTGKYTHDGSYVLIGRQGALCGNIAFAQGKFFASEHAIVVTPSDQADVSWLSIILRKMNLNQYSESSAQPGLSVVKLLLLPCLVPPQPEQTAIAAILSDMDTELAALEARRDKARQLKLGMMQELLTGRTRLV